MRTRNSATSAAVTSLIDDSSSSNYQSLDPLPSSAKSSYDHYRQCNLSMETSSDLPTDLRLGLGIGISSTNFSPKQQASVDWPPIKTLTRRALITTEGGRNNNPSSSLSSASSSSCKEMRHILESTSGDHGLFVKVKMEGMKIGRKIDVLGLHGYPHLITTLEHMFSTPNILWAEREQYSHHKGHHKWSHVLTYEDQDGDWMMVGDVPWEMFLTTVKRLKITRTASS